jgi:hypothetical protein
MRLTSVDQLLGAWRLQSAVEIFDDGERHDEFGPNPDGYLCYNPAGCSQTGRARTKSDV